MSVRLEGVRLPLTDFALEATLDLSARSTAIFGPSGAGKTSLLEVIAGLRRPDAGRVVLHDRVVFDAAAGIDVPPRERRVGYVPQDDALFPHLSVRGNILYGARREGERLDPPRVIEVLEIGNLLDRAVGRLSGGERKRVALARALLSAPVLLLMDEPLSGVSVELRNRVLAYLVRVRDAFPIPILYVTHLVEEAAAVCEEGIALDRGVVTGRCLLGYTNEAAR